MLLRHAVRDPHTPTNHPHGQSHPLLSADTPQPQARLLSTVASKVACIYTSLLRDTSCTLRPGAADAFARVFLRQTSGYFQTLPHVLAEHRQRTQPGQDAATNVAPATVATTPAPLPDIRTHDAPPDSPSSSPASDAAETADTTDATSASASSSGMRSCSCHGGCAAGGAASAAAHLPLRLARLGFSRAGSGGGSTASDTSLSDRDVLHAASPSTPHPAPPRWHTHCDGRVRRHEATCCAPAQHTTPPRAGADAQRAGTVHLWSVDFATQCEHHVLPFYGTLHAVVPAGASAAALSPACLRDIVDMFSLRLQVQERLTHQVCSARPPPPRLPVCDVAPAMQTTAS